MAIVDIIIIAILLIGAMIGFTKGFISSIFGLIATLVALVAAYYLARPLLGIIPDSWGLETTVNGWFHSLLGKISIGGASWSTEISDTQTLTGAIEAAQNGMGFVAPVFKGIFESASADAAAFQFTDGKTTSVAAILAPYIASPVLVIMSMVVLFILIRILLYIIERLLERVTKFAPVKTLDRLLGFVVGVAKAGLFLLIVLTVVTLIFPNTEGTVMKYVLDSKIAVWIMEWNPLPGWLASINLFA